MSNQALWMSSAFVLITLGVSYWRRVGLEKDILIGALRATIQLLGIGYVLLWVFSTESGLALGAILAVMIGVAAQNAAKRGRGIHRVWLPVAAALTVTEGVSLFFMLAAGALEPKAQQIIPVSGMIIGNAMIGSGLFLNRLTAEVDNRRGEILEILALGGTPRQAMTFILRDAIRASMIPTIDAMKTMGLVQLPGMMTGLILAGANPLLAVKYQIMIVFAITTTAAMTSLLLAGMVYPRLFNKQCQLLR